MKQLLLATATLVGMSAAALAAEPVALTDSQLDNVTAGQAANTVLFPTIAEQGGIVGFNIPLFVLPSDTATNLVINTVTAP
jgi:hypothetical protein